jgi:hypothetical protein
MRPEGSVGHEWKADRLPHSGSVPSMVNAAILLCWVSPGWGARSTRVAPFRNAWLPLSGSTTLGPGLGATVFDRGQILTGFAHLSLSID